MRIETEAGLGYQFFYADPGMFFEIYVPSAYEAQTRETLLKGMDIETVKAHLLDSRNRTKIQDLLKDNERLRHYSDDRVKSLNTLLWGFSIYQVDGAFFDGGTIHSEKVAVVRLMFLPVLNEQNNERLAKERFWARQYLRNWTHRLEIYINQRRKSDDSIGKQELEFLERVDTWLDDIDLVIHGFIIHRLCREVLWQRATGLAEKLEQEIWVTSFRSFAVNRVKLLQNNSCSRDRISAKGKRVIKNGFSGVPKQIDAEIMLAPLTIAQIAKNARVSEGRARSHCEYWIEEGLFYGLLEPNLYYRLKTGPQPGSG